MCGGRHPTHRPNLRDKVSAFPESFESGGHLADCQLGILVKSPGAEIMLVAGGGGWGGKEAAGSLEGGREVPVPQS